MKLMIFIFLPAAKNHTETNGWSLHKTIIQDGV